MDRQRILDQLADRHSYPAQSISYCLSHRDHTAAIFIPLLQKLADSAYLDPDEIRPLFMGLHLLGALRLEEAFADVSRLAIRRPVTLAHNLGEKALATSFARILMGLCREQEEALWHAVTTHHLDFLLRDAFLRAWTFEAFEGRVSPAEAARRLRNYLDAEDAPDAEDPIWSGWLTAIADLGYADLKPLGARAVASRRILAEDPRLADMEFHEFETALNDAEVATDRSAFQIAKGYAPFGVGSTDWSDAFLNMPSAIE